MVLGAALLVGSSLLAMILAGISMLFPSKEPEMIEEQPAKETPVIKVEAPAVEEAAPGAKQPTSSSIDEARLRSLLNTPFMRRRGRCLFGTLSRQQNNSESNGGHPTGYRIWIKLD